jgi:hypothetical protein
MTGFWGEQVILNASSRHGDDLQLDQPVVGQGLDDDRRGRDAPLAQAFTRAAPLASA